MFAYLQYSTASGGPFATVGQVNLMNNKVYKVDALTDQTPAGINTVIGYKVETSVTTLSLNSGFSDTDTYYFRLSLNDGSYIVMGEKHYQIFYVNQLTRNDYDQHVIKLQFRIPKNERWIIITPGGLSKIIPADEALLI